MLEKNKAGTGFNLTFHPGPGFFEDYQAYYLDKKPARLTLRTVAEPAGGEGPRARGLLPPAARPQRAHPV